MDKSSCCFRGVFRAFLERRAKGPFSTGGARPVGRTSPGAAGTLTWVGGQGRRASLPCANAEKGAGLCAFHVRLPCELRTLPRTVSGQGEGDDEQLSPQVAALRAGKRSTRQGLTGHDPVEGASEAAGLGMPTSHGGSVIQFLRAVRPVAGPTDGELLGRFVARRDGTAFAELLRRHGPMVLSTCRRLLRHEQDAEDAFQAAFLVLARKAEELALFGFREFSSLGQS